MEGRGVNGGVVALPNYSQTSYLQYRRRRFSNVSVRERHRMSQHANSVLSTTCLGRGEDMRQKKGKGVLLL